MSTLEDKFSSLYGTEAYGGVATVFLPGIQGASVAGPRGDKGPKGDTGDKSDRGPEGPQGTTGLAGAPGKNGATFFPSVDTDGNLSWVNDGSLSNPPTVNIKGPKGDTGDIANLSSFTSDTIIAGLDSSKGVTSAKDINTAATSIAITAASNATDTLKLSLATVATSGKYSDLSGQPDIQLAVANYVGAQGFATSDEVSTTLTAYEKTADLNTTLAGYAKKDELSSLIAAAVAEAKLAAYPVGSIYCSIDSTDPGTLFGGTWVAIGAGRALVAAGGGFAVGSEGGSDTHTLTVEEMPSHAHTAWTGEAGWHGHAARTDTANLTGSFNPGGLGVSASGICSLGAGKQTSNKDYYTDSSIVNINASHMHNVGVDGAGNHTHTVGVGATGGGQAFSVRNPYIAVNMWRRTA